MLLVRNGRVLEGYLMPEGIRRAELEAAIRERGLSDENDCRLVIDGSVSVVPFGDSPKEHHLPPIHRHERRVGRRGRAGAVREIGDRRLVIG
jgi:uncharacterized membrane protein YcaP (DUF421 family)